ncbi:FG-GAP-like repeat-containing protein [Streptomyces sp. SP17BM10]|uniref:FG-GAP-like repeat-containing protein n=1 Tax=Streptomyces sp. SP17BM10 TaxID=3002530 RepID=UPI002E79DC7B|nr:FG-GAP-like repeat-containing protein [Streptomyces sp. SP17BM10]MEE1783412.1 FG-GAP-like repeat-containing protein [Streptomyces sp. SP17BM10]
MEGVVPTTQGLQSPPAASNDRVRRLQAVEARAGHSFQYVDPPALTPAEMSDRLHPNDSGYGRMAQAFYTGLDQSYSAGAARASVASNTASESGGLGRVRYADFDGDGKADYLSIAANGAVSAWLNRGGDGHGGWQPVGQVASGLTTDPSRVRFVDVDGDGRADYAAIDPDGSVHVYLNRGGDPAGGWFDLGIVATGLTTDQSRVRLADFDGDGNADYIRTDPPSNAALVYSWNGGDGHGGWSDLGQVAGGVPTG